MTFFSIAELNAAVHELLAKYNNFVFQRTNYSRRELFLSTEKQYLKPLPATTYENAVTTEELKFKRWDTSICLRTKNYYSVPYRFIGKHVEVSATERVVEYFYNHQRLCHAQRTRSPGITLRRKSVSLKGTTNTVT